MPLSHDGASEPNGDAAVRSAPRPVPVPGGMESPRPAATTAPPDTSVSKAAAGHSAAASLDMSLLGHDIRSAVSDVLGGLRLIEPGSLSRDTALQVSRARAAAETLARLLDTVLQDTAQTEEGSDGPAAFATCPDETPLLELLNDAEKRWKAHASEMNLVLEVVRGPGLPPVIGVDRTSLERILSNLLSNAMKHAGGKPVRLDAYLRPDRALQFTVRDGGAGFAPEVLEHLYGRGVRGNDAPAGGQGMGLHICKDLADRMGGDLRVDSSAKGACVQLVLPPDAWKLSADTLPSSCDLSGRRVLVVEDSPTNQTLLRQMLARLGAQVTTAGNGAAALQAWRSGGHDLALIDIELPEISGLEVIREIRATPGPEGRLPILAVTAYVLRSNREAIFAAGADGVMAKPLNSFDGVSRVLAGLLRRTGLAKPAQGGARPVPELPGDPEPAQGDGLYDRATLRHLLGIAGPQGAEELLTRLKADLRSAQRELADGLARADMPVVRAKTHVLISLTGAIRASCAQKEAERMNDAAHARDQAALAALGPVALQRLERLIAAVDRETVEPPP